jgi:N-methylhydantoinase B
MNNLAFGGFDGDRGRPFAYYETIAGGMGASPVANGISAVHTHMTNSWNTPVEALEHQYPVRIRRYGVRRGSGGAGRHAGGDGIVREYEFLARGSVTLLSDRRERGPWGLDDGGPGLPGRNTVVRGRRTTNLGAKVQTDAQPGDILRIETPGGGGWGPGHPKAGQSKM